MWSGGGGKASKYYTHWHLAKHIEQPLSERDGLISGQPVPTQTTVLASFHCQHLRFQLNFWTLHSQFLFPLFSPHMICPCPRIQWVFHRLHSQSLKIILVENILRSRCSSTMHKNINKTQSSCQDTLVCICNYNEGISLSHCVFWCMRFYPGCVYQLVQSQHHAAGVTATASVSEWPALGFISQSCQCKHHMFLFASQKQYLLLLWFCLSKAFTVQHKSMKPWQDIWSTDCSVTFTVCS